MFAVERGRDLHDVYEDSGGVREWSVRNAAGTWAARCV